MVPGHGRCAGSARAARPGARAWRLAALLALARVAVVAVTTGWAAAEGAPAERTTGTAEAGDGLVLEIGPRSVPCGVDVPRRCPEARVVGESEWRAFDGQVDGYRPREGHASVVVLRALERGPGSASGRFELVHVLAEYPLAGASWTLERHGRATALEEPLPHAPVTFVVAAAGTELRAHLGCNEASAPIAWDGDEVRIGPVVTTLRACEPDVMRQERAVLEVLEGASRVAFYADTIAFAAGDLRARFRAEAVDAPLTWTRGTADPEVIGFNHQVAAAAAGGQHWALDPIRVALAFVDSRGAPRVDVTRRDDRAEAPRTTLVTIVEDGFLDDSVRGAATEVVLVPMGDGRWELWAVRQETRCWRTERVMVAPGEMCP